MVSTLKPLKVGNRTDISKAVARLLKASKVPVIIGGEHSITPFAVRPCKDKWRDLTVLQIDAHADLRDSFEGKRVSHAAAMRRVIEICPVVQAGIRNISREEYSFAMSTGQLKRMHFALNFNEGEIKKIVNQLSGTVYVSIDVDGFDPSIMPSTGTPEPGGLLWRQVLSLLNAVASSKKIVGFDVVEFSPIKGMHAPDFMIAKLIYKFIGYIALSRH
jgi:agmatinase